MTAVTPRECVNNVSLESGGETNDSLTRISRREYRGPRIQIERHGKRWGGYLEIRELLVLLFLVWEVWKEGQLVTPLLLLPSIRFSPQYLTSGLVLIIEQLRQTEQRRQGEGRKQICDQEQTPLLP